jgi:hypothetical protein
MKRSFEDNSLRIMMSQHSQSLAPDCLVGAPRHIRQQWIWQVWPNTWRLEMDYMILQSKLASTHVGRGCHRGVTMGELAWKEKAFILWSSIFKLAPA